MKISMFSNYIKAIMSMLIITLLFACNQSNVLNKKTLAFKKPAIIQPTTKDSITFIKRDFLARFFPIFEGKHKFTDTLYISDKWVNDTTYRNDFIYDYRTYSSDSFRSDGFEIIPDYSSAIYKNRYSLKQANYYYPVYIVNQTLTVKEFPGKDDYLFGLEEALDTNKEWRPIEGRGFDFCGNGYWGLKVHPQEFVVALFPKYAGNYKTRLRVKIRVGNNIYVSSSFEGTINEKQFYLKKEDNLYRELIEDKASAIRIWFYGSQPLETYDTNFGRRFTTTSKHNK
jgi:hypothetical protein